MNETCEDCGGLLGVGAPHACDPGELELKADMKKFERERAAEKLDHAAFFLSTQTIPANSPGWRQGYEFAIKSLRQEASAIRDGMEVSAADECVNDQHRGTECRCGHMVDHCCSHHCCCFYHCKKCQHALYRHPENGKCDFPECSCQEYTGEIRQ